MPGSERRQSWNPSADFQKSAFGLYQRDQHQRRGKLLSGGNGGKRHEGA